MNYWLITTARNIDSGKQLHWQWVFGQHAIKVHPADYIRELTRRFPERSEANMLNIETVLINQIEISEDQFLWFNEHGI